MDYSEMYNAKKTSFEEMAGRVKNGWLIGMDAGASQPLTLISALTERARKMKSRI